MYILHVYVPGVYMYGVCMHAYGMYGCTPQCTCGGQRTSSVPPLGETQRLNSGFWAARQMPLPTKPSPEPLQLSLFLKVCFISWVCVLCPQRLGEALDP